MSQPSPGPHLTGCFVDPRRPLTFTFEGRTIRALAGQSIAAALYASGVRVFTRSFKYHRPRGLLCLSGDCPNCLMRVDGKPNVRTCIEPVRAGQVVNSQNAWPSLNFDVLRVFDRLDRFLPVGFYYKRFHKPRWLWPLFERIVRRIAGLGRIDVDVEPPADSDVEHLHTDVCVVGGGPAGLAAAETAAQAGARVLLFDRQPRPGGHLLYDGFDLAGLDKPLANLRSQPLLRILSDASVFGIYEDNLVGAYQGKRFLKIRAKQVIVCTGGRQRPFLFYNNDLPGIFLGDGVLRLARCHGVPAGQRAVVVTDNDRGHRLARDLHEMGTEVAAVVDSRKNAAAGSASWPVLHSSVIVAARGSKRLKGIKVAPLHGEVVGQPEQQISCELLCMASELVPANELLLQAGLRYRYENGAWLPNKEVPGLLAAGAVAGARGLSGQVHDGRRRGAEAAAALGFPHLADFGFSVLQFPDALAEAAPSACSLNHCRVAGNNRKAFVCLCEDVTEKDIQRAVAEGFDGIETLKRYSTASMGPCQGKVCGATTSEVCARVTGKEVNAVGTTTSRPPAIPVELGLLAAERRHQPIRRTPMHHWHEANGAKWMDAGAWKRPESYGNAQAEVQAVRTQVGLIDVSTLGKIELRGPDAAELLERIYVNSWADLKLGRARYGVMCTDEGILFDDGVGARLDLNRFYLTATTGNADAVVQWLELWRTTWGLDVVVHNQTSSMGAMNLAGPKSRDILASLTDMDVSPASFPYLAMREGRVAGVQCRLFRLGFVGELGYEIHCPSSLALSLWQALIAAGSAHGLKPFGVEAQRILRLEKGHIIIGQDTDALSLPLDAGLGALVKFAKPLFHGREPLLRLKEMGARSQLVGFHFPDEKSIPCAPASMREWEGCQVVDQGRPLGRVTSLRFSPTLGRCVGLAWAPADKAGAGARWQIRWHEQDVVAEVVPTPFYDPEGKRMKN